MKNLENIAIRMWLKCSTWPSDCGRYGIVLVCGIFNNLHISFIKSDWNSGPWLECNILGAPNRRKISFTSVSATARAWNKKYILSFRFWFVCIIKLRDEIIHSDNMKNYFMVSGIGVSNIELFTIYHNNWEKGRTCGKDETIKKTKNKWFVGEYFMSGFQI